MFETPPLSEKSLSASWYASRLALSRLACHEIYPSTKVWSQILQSSLTIAPVTKMGKSPNPGAAADGDSGLTQDERTLGIPDHKSTQRSNPQWLSVLCITDILH